MFLSRLLLSPYRIRPIFCSFRKTTTAINTAHNKKVCCLSDSGITLHQSRHRSPLLFTCSTSKFPQPSHAQFVCEPLPLSFSLIRSHPSLFSQDYKSFSHVLLTHLEVRNYFNSPGVDSSQYVNNISIKTSHPITSLYRLIAQDPIASFVITTR